MGFPKRSFDAHCAYGFDGKRMRLSANAYICPRCSTRTSDIPTQCCVCHLQLNSSSHIARSHHHLFPVPNYIEYEVRESEEGVSSADAGAVKASSAVQVNSEKMTLTLKKGAGASAKAASLPVRRKIYTAVHQAPTTHAHTVSNSGGDSSSSGGADGTGDSVDREVVLSVESGYSSCKGCLEPLGRDGKLVLRCPQCRHFFCVECDLFVHDSLHNCPGCG
jgi:transcription initiation factor TFIIH subunit 2